MGDSFQLLGCPLSIQRSYSTMEPPAEITGPVRGGWYRCSMCLSE